MLVVGTVPCSGVCCWKTKCLLRSASGPAARHPGVVEKMVIGNVGSGCRGLASPTMPSSSFRETRELLLPSQRCSQDLRVGDRVGCGCNTTGDTVTSTGWWDRKQM